MGLYIKYRAKNGQGWARGLTNAVMTRFMAGPPLKIRWANPGHYLLKSFENAVMTAFLGWPTITLVGPPLQ